MGAYLTDLKEAHKLMQASETPIKCHLGGRVWINSNTCTHEEVPLSAAGLRAALFWC